MSFVVNGVPALVKIAVGQKQKTIGPNGLAMAEMDGGPWECAQAAIESVAVQLGLKVCVVPFVEGDIGAPVADVGDRLDWGEIHGEVSTTTEPPGVEIIDQAPDPVDIPFVDVDAYTDREFDVFDP